MKPFIVMLVLFLTACAAPGPKFSSIPLPSDGSSILYLMKTKGVTGLNTNFLVDNESIGKANSGQYVWVKIKPGSYIVRAEDEDTPYFIKREMNKLNIHIEILPNKEYYIERLDESTGGLQYSAILRALTPNVAKSKISNLNLSKNQINKIFSGAPRVMPNPQKDKATVFFYRSTKNSSGVDLDIILSANNKEICSLGSQMYTFKHMSEGEYTMQAIWPTLKKPLFDDQYNDKFLKVSIKNGKTYYINYKAEKYSLYNINTDFAEESESEAMINIARSTYQENCRAN